MKPLKYAILDIETSIQNEGDPFDPRNYICLVGIRTPSDTRIFDIHYSDTPYGENLLEIKKLLLEAGIVVGFNLKFDLHWIKRYIHDIDYSTFRTWDCQLVEFLLSNQRIRFPALDEVCNYYHLGSKLDVVASEYWNHGIETKLVPFDTLFEYLTQDLDLTEKLYLKQTELLEEGNHSEEFKRLIYLHNLDLLALQEMEFNGMLVDRDKINTLQVEITEELKTTNQKIKDILNIPEDIPYNINSTAQLSAILYGGAINYSGKIKKERVLKSGQIKITEINGTLYHLMPQMFKPEKRSESVSTKSLSNAELEKLQQHAINTPGTAYPYRKYSTDLATLASLKTTSTKSKNFIDLLMTRSKLEQQLTTYLNKLPEMFDKHQWENNIIHGQFNQCVARTGRLSSSKPNLQNMDSKLHHLFISRFS